MIASANGLLRRPGRRALFVPGVDGNYVTTPNATANALSGALDIRILMRSKDWAGATQQYILDKAAGANGYSMVNYLGGKIRFGTSTWGVDSDAHGITDGIWWIRATSTASAGVVSFYKSKDGVTWTALGTAVDGGRVASGASLWIGAANTGIVTFNGWIYRVEIYDVIDGTTPKVFFDANDARNRALSFASSRTGELYSLTRAGNRPAEFTTARLAA